MKTTKEITEYFGSTYKYGQSTQLAVEDLKSLALKMPDDPPANATKTKQRVWEKEVTNMCRRRHNWRRASRPCTP
jgi:hypothetical protein